MIKKYLMLCLAALPWLSHGAEKRFVLDNSIHNNQTTRFISHHGPGRFDAYLTMNIHYPPVKALFAQLAADHPLKLKNRGEAHITVITPPEFADVLQHKISIVDIDKIAAEMAIQSSAFSVLCLGRGTAQIKQQPVGTFYLLVESTALLNIRHKIHALYVLRGGQSTAFIPTDYFPHITLAFSVRDLHESDGVIKNRQSCYAKLIPKTHQ
jgi:2'-5' RNA ligase